MHGQHRGRDARQRPFEERSRQFDEHTPREQYQQAGGRSERFARQRDQEQMRAGYPARDWERDPGRYRNTRSEPRWDPGAEPQYRDDQRWRADDAFSEPAEYHEPTRYEPGGFPQGLRPAAGRDWDSSRDWNRSSSWDTERDLRSPRHHSELGQRLEDAGRRLVGKVKRLVRNPKNYKRSDDRIREDICDRLAVSTEVDPSEVEVQVEAGEVTLTGFVADRRMKFVAEDIADDVPGVHEIHNQLRIQRDEGSRAEPANNNAPSRAEQIPPSTRGRA